MLQISLDADESQADAMHRCAVQYMYSQAHVPTHDVIKGFVIPRVPGGSISQAVALVGSLIMPHNIYLHSALVKTRKLRRDDDEHKREALMYFGLESGFSLLVREGHSLWCVCSATQLTVAYVELSNP